MSTLLPLVSPDDVVFVGPVARSAWLKEHVKLNSTIVDMCANFIYVRDYFGFNHLMGEMTHDEGLTLFSDLVLASKDLGELKDNLITVVKDPQLLQEYDGFLTVKFNKIANRIDARMVINITSFIADLEAVKSEAAIDRTTLPEGDTVASTICETALLMLHNDLVSSAKAFLEAEITADVLGDLVGITNNKTRTIWSPIFSAECSIILNNIDSIRSFKNYLSITDENKTPVNTEDFIWLDKVMECYNDPINGEFFRNTRHCRLTVLDPYLTTKEYEIYIPKNGKPVLVKYVQ